ncbi:MAG: isoleucine--tRNA ligase [Candidatus Pacearchaeota archaeon]
MEDINSIEEKILDFWKRDKTFEKSLKKTKNKKAYVFYDGPPFATGTPHPGTILSSVSKDVFGRFWTMKGFYVPRVWGWDCHGLPIENLAEKDLGINSKDEIEKIGVNKFNDFCRNKVLGYETYWKKMISRIGRWVDMDEPYKTMDNDYIESVWWAFKKLHEKGFLYEGEKVLMYCPRCSTPLAKAEIAMDNSYKNVEEESIVVKFKLKNEDAYALAWTTTPWTLPSNLALSVNPNLDYVYLKDKSDGSVYILVKNSIKQFFKNPNEYEIIKKVKGKSLEGKKYEPLFNYFKNHDAFKIILGDFVSSEEGTGIVHTAPAFGEEDYEVSKKYGIGIVQPVDEKGKFTKEVKDFEGMFVHHSNKKILEHLKEKGKVVAVRKIKHEYPFCYRCDTKLIYRAVPAWFVNIQKIKPRLIKLSKKINWHPGFLKEGRVKNTFESAPDWNISRNRYWASAMPVWVSKDGEKLIIENISELKKYAKNLNSKRKIDLHKDFLDKIILEKDGKEFRRVPEVLDVWFDSGAMTFAQFHYPFENKAFFEKNFPAQFVAEYIGQIRAWFYYMIVLSVILFDKIPFENVLTTGNLLSADGQKISKSKKNYTDPYELIEKYGVDALRFYLMSCPVMNAEDFNFMDSGVEEVYKKIILLSYNTLKFYELNKSNSKNSKPKFKDLTDKWILSRLNETGIAVNDYLEKYDTIKTCNEIKRFIDDLSTWYVRLNRERISDEDNAKNVLKYVLNNFSKIIASILPFTAEKLFQGLNGEKNSVHLEEYPKFSKKEINSKVLKDMELIREVVSKGLKERDREKIGLKWPLLEAIISGKQFGLGKNEKEIIMEQLNVKKVSYNKKDVELEVNLNTQQNKELEAEGYMRELSRQVQSQRKNLGLNKGDIIELKIFVDEEFKKMLRSQESSLKNRTNSKKLEILLSGEKSKESFKNSINFKIRNKEGEMAIITKK